MMVLHQRMALRPPLQHLQPLLFNHSKAQGTSTLDPSSLLVMPGTTNSWLEASPKLATKSGLQDLQLPQPKMDALNRNLTKAVEWWQNQHDTAGAGVTISRVSVGYGHGPHQAAGQHLV